MSATSPHRPLTPFRRLTAPSVFGLAATIVLLTPAPAAAHHGWDGFDTDELVYIAGTVASEGSWGEPHTYFDTTIDTDLPADTPDLRLPEDLQGPEDSIRVESALAYAGPQDELEVIIAPPAYTGRWGLDRPLTVGERFQGVGYINRSDDALFRPVAFWYGDDAVPVNQVLGSTLPVRAPLPTSAGGGPGATTPAPATTSTAADPLEEAPSDPEESVPSEGDAEATSDEASTGVAGVWAVFGIVVAAGVAGGLVSLRRRNRQS
ncbi:MULTISPECIES: hypothetical protein [Rathayibacter]|uniref:hypothetical protein n=1 Tax=Rathayibacter TaxID=33886 RepID=UPI000FA390A8|nr:MULTISPECIES: hypothetical protein [Rathayibacter]ROQ05650.1 hypothetical protein EDF54_2274 [Rathayibacter sp. PhB93]TDQ12280.1 hypothetical protein EDF17_2133 [Rathayibacter sp. PhB1]